MSRALFQLAKSGQQPRDFVGGVVMDDADTKQAAFLFHAEPFGEIERVIVAVPGEDAAVAEMFGDIDGLVVQQAERNRGAAIAEAFRVANTEKFEAGYGEQAVDELR